MGTTIPSAQQTIVPFPAMSCRKPPRTPSFLSVLTHPTFVTINEDDLNHSLKINTKNNTTTTTSKTVVYHDNLLESIAIDYISKAFQETSGLRNEQTGYDGFVAVSSAVFREFDPTQQRQVVDKTLEKAIPGFMLIMIRNLMPESKFTREFFAIFTTVFFRWLVGPSEVRESEFEGKKERNVVHIQKCRFLEQANCIGMCTNLCKIPTQEFIKKNFGTPVNMVPNFDDMSCEIIFGQDPPAQEDDPAFKQPCYKLCNVKKRHSASCIK
ncbi:unnamed protein product [Lactuca saligna]|uniref:Beta-carotene isomerase D27-like C-terminal domain-containing protein n=1 Tax=Lactuca saligna TaxID=75948 RepID=A0AA35ZXC2_LACSI|nr:unnamed protein product [Lactuca saligna]